MLTISTQFFNFTLPWYLPASFIMYSLSCLTYLIDECGHFHFAILIFLVQIHKHVVYLWEMMYLKLSILIQRKMRLSKATRLD